MELRQLKGFLAVAEYLSFSRAAEKLYISQSALSEQIKQLEEELGAPLFRRSSHRVVLTEAGERLRPVAAKAWKDAEACRDVVRGLKEGIGGRLRIGVTSTCKSLLKAPIREMVMKYPKLQVQIECSNAIDIRHMLLHKQVDLAITLHPQRISDEVESLPIFKDRLCFICSKTHAVADRAGVTFSEVMPYPLILPSPELVIRKDLNRVFANAGLAPTPRLEVSEPELMIEMVEHSQLATLHAGIVINGKENLRAVPITDCTEVLVGCIHWLRDSYSKPSAELLKELIKAEADKQAILSR